MLPKGYLCCTYVHLEQVADLILVVHTPVLEGRSSFPFFASSSSVLVLTLTSEVKVWRRLLHE